MKLEDSLGPVRQLLGGMHQTGTTLIKRGTAMGPLIPVLLLVPVLFAFAWLFSDVVVIAQIPGVRALCLAAIVVIFGHYLWHYSKFAKNDPDRLQSEQYRVQMQHLQLVAAKDLPEPLPAEVLEDPTANPVTLESQDSDGDDRPSESTEEPPP